MKILACHNYYQQLGGEDLIFADEVSLLRAHGHDVVEFTLHNDSIHSMGRIELARKTLWNPQSAEQVRQIIHDKTPDILHCINVFPLLSPSVYHTAKKAGVPVIQSLQNFRTICPKAQFTRDGKPCEDCLGRVVPWPAILHRCYRNSLSASSVLVAMSTYHWARKTWTEAVDRFLAPTQFTMQKHIEGGIPANRIEVKPNFVNNDNGIGNGDGKYFVFVGRLSPEKGIETLLSAWKLLPPNYQLRIVGDGPMASLVEATSTKDDRIDWLGFRSLDEVLSIIGNATSLIIPSTWYEALARTIIEAYSKGTPVIASKLGAMAETVMDGETGLLFEPGNAEELASKCKQLHDDPELAFRMRQRARDEYETKYTADVNYRMLMDVYKRVLNESN